MILSSKYKKYKEQDDNVGENSVRGKLANSSIPPLKNLWAWGVGIETIKGGDHLL